MNQNDQRNSEGQDQGPNRSIVAIIREAMQDAPSGTKALLGMFGAIMVLAAGVGGVLAAAGESTWAFWTFALAVVCVFGAIAVLLRLERPVAARNGDDDSGQDAPAGEALRSLILVKVPVRPAEPVQEIREKMEDLRNSVWAWLRAEQHVEIEARDIRAHIFIPDYHLISRCGVLPLFMPDIWQINMKGHNDEQFRVRPGQGVAGLTYESEKPQRFVIKDGLWPSELSFDAQQRAMRHPEITWIVGIPLTVPEGGPTLGVLGIHGLRVGITSEQADQLFGKTHYMAAAITARLAKIEQGTFEVHFRSR